MSKKPVAKRCGTCRHLRPRSDGKPFHHSHSYACKWRMPVEYKFPQSMLNYYEWGHRLERLRNGHIDSYMETKDGTDCECWETRHD